MPEKKYDILRDTWIYQEIHQEVRAETLQCQISEQRDLLQEIVQARFPRLQKPVQQAADQADEAPALRRLIIIISTARTEKEARQWLHTVQQDK
jgi:hypothetical protein